ncbi:MAG: hypothetical protein FIB01_07720 [Gemmatimonadetes bacterium]|nr:hypothetical protein [Gemmatimonadota bacterium]
MNKAMRLYAPIFAIVAFFGYFCFPIGHWLKIIDYRIWLIRMAIMAIGGIIAAIYYLFMAARLKDEEAEKAPEGGDDLGLALASAQARLAAAGGKAESRVARLPLVLALGPGGATKTSVIAHSGLDADLLSGEIMRGDVPIPTDPVNVWYANGTIILEAGGRLLDDNARWQQLARRVRPSRLAAAMGRGRQAPRVALVCFPCDELTKAGAAESIPAAARRLRTRLAELSQELGIRLPVYVLFTKADRLPQFAEFVRNLSTDEAQQVLGATLPYSDDPPGVWAEAQAKRLHAAFDRLGHRLAVARLEILSRESELPARGAAYEFPRELRKVTDLAVQFLVDVVRPSQLGLNPFLRGFYFTGVRPVVLTDAAPPVEAAASPMASGATSVFNARALQQQAMAAAPRGGRKVPQWVFLRRLFREVLLGDDLALRITAGGARVDLLRRSLIGAAAAALIFVALAMTVSFAGNRKLVRTSIAAASAAKEVGGVGSLVGEEDLATLAALRERTALETRYEREGRPLHLAWGLYTGAAVQPLLRRIYFARFEGALWRDTQDRLLAYLRGLPEQPDENSDFGKAQDALAAHLLTTSENGRSTTDLLAPVLTAHARPMGTDSALATEQRQFAFFAQELPYGNPYDARADEPLVERTQGFLRAFGPEAYYRALVSEGGRTAPAVRFNGPQNVVHNETVVPGAFTMTGYTHVQTQLDSVDNLMKRYEWVYGAQPPTVKPRRDELAQMYLREYIRRWQDYIGAASVVRFSSPADAAMKLGTLSTSGSPLFVMLAIASRETNKDSTSAIGKAFQPLHAAVPPTPDASGATAAAGGYTAALNGLSSAMRMLAGGGRDDALMPQAMAGAAQVRGEAAAMAATFSRAGDADVTASHIQRLLQQPADFADQLVSGLPVAALNAAGQDFCGTYASLTRAFPFNIRASADASVDEVNAMFAKDQGTLSSFYQDALQPLLTPQGRLKAGSRARAEFARFYARAAEFSAGAYRGPAQALVFDIQTEIPAGASEVMLQVDGDQASFTPTNRASRSFLWEAERAREARLVVAFGGERITVASGTGPWAPFRVFYAADWRDSGPYRVEWRIPGRDVRLVGTISFESGVPPLLRPSYTGALAQCVSQITN